jgi:WD40 repeat protein
MPQVLGTMNYQQIANEAIQKLIKYEVKHTICSKALIYYTSRFGVIYNTVKSSQTFYQGHSVKISAITKHPISSIVATGEVASSSPNIHIWDAATLETIVILKTAHRGGVMHLTFSNDGSLLLSVGMDKTFSMQVFQW